MFRVNRLALLWFASVALANLAVANDNMLEETVVNIRLYLGLSSHEKDVKVSGTNVNLGFTCGGVGIAEPPPGPQYDVVEVIHLKIKCLNSTDLDVTYYPPAPPPPQTGTLSKTLRIASTRFADGTTISFEVKAKFRLIDNDIGGLGTAEPERTHIATIVAYNKCQLLGTNVNFAGTTDPLFQSNSDQMTQAAASMFSASHTMAPGGGVPARSETSTSITGKITESTTMFVLTHGSPLKFDNSQSTAPAVWFNWVLGGGIPDVRQEVDEKAAAGIPAFGVVAFWACQTIPEGSVDPMVGFGLIGPNQVYLGFRKNLQITLYSKAERDPYLPGWPPFRPQLGLANHAETFLDHLQLGATVQWALNYANQQFPPLHYDGTGYSSNNMIAEIDEYSTLRYVYLSSYERGLLSLAMSDIYDDWWIETPVSPP